MNRLHPPTNRLTVVGPHSANFLLCPGGGAGGAVRFQDLGGDDLDQTLLLLLDKKLGCRASV